MENKIEQILNRLTAAVNGTDKEYYEEEELLAFANYFQKAWDNAMEDDELVDAFVDYWLETEKLCRRCDVCGELMNDGFCLDMGREFYCSEACLRTQFPDDEEWKHEYEYNLEDYFTTWF